jgi:hypothetical protein
MVLRLQMTSQFDFDCLVDERAWLRKPYRMPESEGWCCGLALGCCPCAVCRLVAWTPPPPTPLPLAEGSPLDLGVAEMLLMLPSAR